MNKQESLELIRETQKSIKDIMEALQYKINDLDAIRKAVVLLVPDDIKEDDTWIKDGNQIHRELQGEEIIYDNKKEQV